MEKKGGEVVPSGLCVLHKLCMIIFFLCNLCILDFLIFFFKLFGGVLVRWSGGPLDQVV